MKKLFVILTAFTTVILSSCGNRPSTTTEEIKTDSIEQKEVIVDTVKVDTLRVDTVKL